VSALISPALARVVRAANEVFAPPAAPDPVPVLERVFADAKVALRRGLVLMLWAFELGPLPYRFSRFSRLPLPERVAWVTRLSRSKGALAKTLYSVLKVLLQSSAYDASAAY